MNANLKKLLNQTPMRNHSLVLLYTTIERARVNAGQNKLMLHRAARSEHSKGTFSLNIFYLWHIYN